MGGFARSKIFFGTIFPKGDPLVSKLSTFAQYIVFPGVMFASLYYCPEDHPDKKKKILIPSST